MEYASEIVNISKIEDGFFVGDKFCGTNIDVIIQFKITHVINASGNQILNQFETLGVKYLTLYWQENPNQVLFEPNDEIPNKIISFIEESFLKGEGLLVLSMKGINRALIVVVIYFMKKFFWSVKKCVEFLNIKVKNGKIAKYFLTQLENYEKQIKFKMSNEWYNTNNIKSDEEKIIRNTYLNSVLNGNNKYKDLTKFSYKNKYNFKHHVSWGTINNVNENDLYFQKNIKDIDSHIRLKPRKKCIRTAHSIIEDADNEKILNYINANLKKYMSNNIVNKNIDINEKGDMKNLINLGLNMKIVDKINQISNNFNNLSLPKQRPSSAEQKNKEINARVEQEKQKSDLDKLSNYFDKLEKREKEKMAQNKNYKKVIIKQVNNKLNKSNNLENSKRKKAWSNDKINNKKRAIKINRQFYYPNKIINNSININMINYITNNSSQQMPSIIKNNNYINNNNSFSVSNSNYEPYNFFNKEEDLNIIGQYDYNKMNNRVKQRNIENKKNKSAINFYNYNSQKNKENTNNNYYNVMGQSFNVNSNKVKNNNKKLSIYLKNSKNMNNTFIYKTNSNYIRMNAKNYKRSSTPNNLLPKRNNYLSFSNDKTHINYINYSKVKFDEPEMNNNNSLNNDNMFTNKSFVSNQKNQRNQCKYISIIK